MNSIARPAVKIRRDDLTGAAVIALLQEHVQSLAAVSPPESCHVLDLSGLRKPEITFWSAWLGPELAGCGALKALDATHGEIKSMRTATRHLRQGVAHAMLQHLLAEAKSRRYRRVSLETGAMEFFAPARALYARCGFVPCEAFGDYRPDPNSVFLTREI